MRPRRPQEASKKQLPLALVGSWPPRGPKTPPRRAKRPPREPQDGPSCPQDAPRRPKTAPRRHQKRPQTTQDAPKTAQDVLRRAQDGPRRPRDASKTPKDAPKRFKNAQECQRMSKNALKSRKIKKFHFELYQRIIANGGGFQGRGRGRSNPLHGRFGDCYYLRLTL